MSNMLLCQKESVKMLTELLFISYFTLKILF